MIPIFYRDAKVTSILDGREGVNIITNNAGKSWGSWKWKPPYQLKLADGATAKPIGILRDIGIKAFHLS